MATKVNDTRREMEILPSAQNFDLRLEIYSKQSFIFMVSRLKYFIKSNSFQITKKSAILILLLRPPLRITAVSNNPATRSSRSWPSPATGVGSSSEGGTYGVAGVTLITDKHSREFINYSHHSACLHLSPYICAESVIKHLQSDAPETGHVNLRFFLWRVRWWLVSTWVGAKGFLWNECGVFCKRQGCKVWTPVQGKHFCTSSSANRSTWA